jgi:hypothetical protein
MNAKLEVEPPSLKQASNVQTNKIVQPSNPVDTKDTKSPVRPPRSPIQTRGSPKTHEAPASKPEQDSKSTNNAPRATRTSPRVIALITLLFEC